MLKKKLNEIEIEKKCLRKISVAVTEKKKKPLQFCSRYNEIFLKRDTLDEIYEQKLCRIVCS